MTVEVHPATADRWADVATVMGAGGDPARCWCQYFILRGKSWGVSPATKRRRLRLQVTGEGPPPGVVAYLDGEPVGWCAVAPTTAYPRLAASTITTTSERDGAWSITCFVVRVGFRRRGVSTALLSGAVELARANGASLVEAYPVDADTRGKVTSSELYHGVLSAFLAAGFTEVARPAPARPRVELAVS